MKVSACKPGMVLGQDVRDVNGRLLMRVGDRLDERSLSVLKAWGVEEVTPWDEKDAAPGQAGGELPESVSALAHKIAAAKLARNSLDHPFIQEILSLMVECLGARMLSGEVFRVPPVTAPLTVQNGLPPLTVEDLTGSDRAIGAIPEVLVRLSQSMEDPRTSPAELAGIIQYDPGLAANLLKVVNSAFYGFPQHIETISRAVTVIGVQQLSALAVGMTAMSLFAELPGRALDYAQFWRHSLACACGARALASACGLANTERFFVAGLLHDVGVLLMLLYDPGRMGLALQSVRESGEPLLEAERRILGVDHAAAGQALLTLWMLPESLVQAVAGHHEPVWSAGRPEAAIVHIADFLAEALYCGSSGQPVLPALDTRALSALSAPPGMAGLMARRIDGQVIQLEPMFTAYGSKKREP